MKILIINVSCGTGSTGVIAVEIAERLKQQGNECYIAYAQGDTNYLPSYRIETHLGMKFHAFFNTRVLGEEGSGSYFQTKRFLNYIDEVKPDIVHILNLHTNYLNYKLFFEYLRIKKIPVVWSIFDCWTFTGKCTHFAENGCRKWEKGCGKCPQLHTSGPATWFFDKTSKLYNQKKAWTDNLVSLDIIACSNWLKEEVEKSFLKNHHIHMIYNWIDQTKFLEMHDDSIYEKYNLDRTKKLLVSVSAIWDDKTTRFADANRFADILPDEYQLILVGQKATQRPVPKNTVFIPYVEGTVELSKLYSASLAFIGFSVEDTFGKVFAESMLCGTPAVVFNSTACPEVVGDTGYSVSPHNVEDMVRRVIEIDNNGKKQYSQRCKDRVRECYSYPTNVDKYIKVYQNIIDRAK